MRYGRRRRSRPAALPGPGRDALLTGTRSSRLFQPILPIWRTNRAGARNILVMGGLIERAAELAAVSDLLSDALGGTGRSLTLSGPAGVGKSALVGHATEHARMLGMRVLTACPTPVTSQLSHAVVRDWLAPLAREASPGEKPFDGPAAALGEALAGPGLDHHPWTLASLDYALAWLLENVAADRPVLLVVDDVQWADLGSLQLLDLLSARLHLSPVAMLLGLRTGEPVGHADVLHRVVARSTSVSPQPLSVVGVAALRADLDDAYPGTLLSAQEVHDATGGVPFLVHEILREGTAGGTPQTVVESLRHRLGRLGAPAVQLARTVAVLGDEASFDAVADLTAQSVADIADPLEVLVDAGVLAVGMWRAWPAHPLVREAILSALTPSQRSDLHRKAAAHLTALGRPRQAVASHLLHTLPDEDPAVVELLRAAGEESLDSGVPDVAAAQLFRAVGETRPEDTDPGLLALAASAHLSAGLRTEAFDLWRRSLERTTGTEERASRLADIGDLQMTLGERNAAQASYQEAIGLLTGDRHDASSPALRKLLARMGMARALYDGSDADLTDAVEDAVRQPRERDTHADRLLLSWAASDLAVRGHDRERALALAGRALGDGALLAEETCDGIGFYVASAVLSWSDAYDENLAVLDAALEDSRRRGSVLGFATASYCRGFVRYRQGRLREALVEFEPALQMRARGWSDFAEPALAGATLTHLALGQHQDALALEPLLRQAARRAQFLSALPIAVAGLVRATHGDHEQALADYAEAGRLMGPRGDNASIVEWRELTAWSLMSLGREDEARATAEEAVHLARRWGAPRGLGFALRTLAQTTHGDEAVGHLREALALLESADLADYAARTAIDLGARLATEEASRDEGVSLLEGAFRYARATDVPPLARRASGLLTRHGVPVPDSGGSPLASLTPGERRVVELAAAGYTNRQIAQSLFVTVKAVEWHLSNAYRKLEVTRAQLPDLLAQSRGESSSSDM